MAEKVKIPRKQADAIETLRNGGIENDELVLLHVKGSGGGTATAEILKAGLDDFIKAVYIGYEVEPEYMLEDWAKFHHYGDEWVAKIRGTHKIGKGETLYLPDYDIHVMTDDRYYRISDPTPEEIKAEQERRVWEKIGRGVDEWKDGDCIMIDGDYVRINTNMGCDDEYFNNVSPKRATERKNYGDVQGIFPVESFVSFAKEGAANA